MKRLTKIFQALLGVVALILTALVAAGRLAWCSIRNWWKRRSRLLRRSVVTIFIIVPVGFAALVAYVLYVEEYGRDYCDRRLSDNIILHSFGDNMWRVYDCTTEEYTTDKFNWLSDASENDSLAVYALADRRGYINVNTGSIVIDAEANEYGKAWVFSDGLAAVVKEGRIGFINASNEIVIPFRFEYTDKCRMWDCGYVFHNGYCIMTDAEGNLGVIDKNGTWVVEPEYDEIWAPHSTGYRVVVKDGRHGILDSRCDVVYPAEYGYVSILPDGFVLTRSGRRWQVDFEGNTIQPFMFDNTSYLNYPIGCNESGDIQYVLSDYMKYELMNCCGIMNRITGEPVTPAVYSDINMLSRDLFEVQRYDCYDWFLLDVKGKRVLR